MMHRVVFWAALLSMPLYAKPLHLDSYYQQHRRGWFWYETEPDVAVIPPEVEPTPPPLPAEPVAREDVPLSHAWYRKHFQTYKDAAYDHPDNEEAMMTYLYLEKALRDKAVTFGYARQDAVYADPYLDETSQRPTSNFGMKAFNQAAKANQSQLLGTLSQRSGVFFFYRSDCPYCKQQAPILAALAAQYGFTIKPVSMDGQPLPGFSGDYLVNQGQAEMAGISVVPAMVLFDGESQRMSLIAQGLQSLPELAKRLIATAERLEMIPSEAREQTRPSGLYPSPSGGVARPQPAMSYQELVNTLTQQ